MFMPTLQSGSISIPRMQRYQNCVNVVFLLSSHLLLTLTVFIAVFRIITTGYVFLKQGSDKTVVYLFNFQISYRIFALDVVSLLLCEPDRPLSSGK